MTTIGRVSTLRKWVDPDMDLFDFSAMSVNDPRVTFTGQNGRTYYDDDRRLRLAAANEMRFEKGNDGQRYLRLDPQATNIIGNSSAPHLHTASNVIKSESRVFAGYNMSKMSSSTILTASHYVTAVASIILGAGGLVSAQCVLKMGGYRYARLIAASGGNIGDATIDLLTGQILGNQPMWQLERLADEVYLLKFNGGTATEGSTSTLFRVFVHETSTLGTAYSGDGVKGIWVGGIQMETGPMATAFIPTGTSSVTRTPEYASVMGQSFLDAYNPSAWTLLVDSLFSAKPTSTAVLAAIGTATSANDFAYVATNALWAGIVSVRPPGGSQTTVLSRLVAFELGRGKIGVRYDGSQYIGMANGTIASAGFPLAALATVDRIVFGAVGSASGAGTIFRILSARLYRKALSDNEYSTLTRL